MAETTFFKLPTDPEEFGVVLDPPKLRRINFSALDFATIRRAIIEYMKAYYPDRFNDFVTNNGIIMVSELVSYIGEILSQRGDVLVEDSFLPTANSEVAVTNHLALINNRIRRATPAVVDIAITINSPAPTPIQINPGLLFTLAGPDGKPVNYELYRAPNDFTSKIVIPPGKRGVIGFGLEGRFATPVVVESAGGANQSVVIKDDNILDKPIYVTWQTGSTIRTWKQISTLEKAGPNDEVFEVKFDTGQMTIKFGNDQTGKAPLAGQIGTFQYRVGGGIRGRIPTNAINETRPISPDAPASAPVEVQFVNPAPSNGGTDKESLTAAKRRAPKESATLEAAVSGEDYAQLAKTFSHPVYGSVLKAVATVRTSLNANIVELYVLAAGPDDVPVTPSLGLKRGLETYFKDINVLTDEVRAIDGAIKSTNLEADIIISKNADPTIVKSQVDQVVSDYFDLSNFDMGQPLHISTLYEAIQKVEGVKFVKIFEPADDILASGKLAADTPDKQVGFDQLITLGQTKIQFFFER